MDLAQGTKVNNNYTSLQYASWFVRLEIVKDLLAIGVQGNKTDIYGETPLHLASIYGHLEIVNVLLAAGADVNNANIYGRTPLYRASIDGSLRLVELLLAANAEGNKTTYDYGMTLSIEPVEKINLRKFLKRSIWNSQDLNSC